MYLTVEIKLKFRHFGQHHHHHHHFSHMLATMAVKVNTLSHAVEINTPYFLKSPYWISIFIFPQKTGEVPVGRVTILSHTSIYG